MYIIHCKAIDRPSSFQKCKKNYIIRKNYSKYTKILSSSGSVLYHTHTHTHTHSIFLAGNNNKK